MSKQNARAKAAGGYQVMDPIIKNKHADVYYRKAINAETEKMLDVIFSELEKVYTTIRVSNAKPQGTKPSIKNIEKLIAYYKTEYLPKFLRNSEKIIRKFLNIARRNSSRR